MLKQWLNKNTIESIQILKDRYLSLATIDSRMGSSFLSVLLK